MFIHASLRICNSAVMVARAALTGILIAAFAFFVTAHAESTSTYRGAHFDDGSSPRQVRTKLKKSDGTNESGRMLAPSAALVPTALVASAGGNLIQNPGFENAGTNGLPANWFKGGYGSNTRTLSYPVVGINGSKAVKVSITNYVSGDAKWHFAPVAVTAGTYTYSDQYSANVSSIVTAQFQNADGSFSYKDIATLPASSAFKTVTADFAVPSGAKNVTVFHLIKSNGSLTIDNASLLKKSTSTSVFSTGAVTLRFDDGWKSQYKNALPKLISSGFKGTFYIVTRQLSDNGFTGYVSKTEVQQLFANGMEIGAHTRSHRDLTTLSSSEQQSEIQGSRQDLLSWNVGPILSFSYPFGAYFASTIQHVKDAGFTSAVATIDGNVTPTSDPYQLERRSVINTTTLSEVQSWIDEAATKKVWLILTFHEVDTVCNTYCVSPTRFNQIIDYLKTKNIPVVTVSQAVQSLQ